MSWLNSRSVRLVLSLGMVLGIGASGTLATWTDFVAVSGTTVTTGSLAAPTPVNVSQACVVEPTPVRRPGAGGTSTATTAGGTLTISVPSGAVAGDLLLAGVAAHGDYRTTPPTAPAGWTLTAKTATGGLGQMAYTHVVTATEPATYSWTGLTSNAAGGMAAYSGVDTTTPVSAAAGNTSQTAPSLTTTRANNMLVGFFSATSTTAAAAPPSMTPIWSAATANGGASQQASTMVAEESWPSTGATGTRTTSTSAMNQVSQIVALQPPVRPYATVTWTPSTSTFATAQRFQLLVGGSPQPAESLLASTTSKYVGLVTTGTSYRADVSATFETWVSAPGAVAFVGRTC